MGAENSPMYKDLQQMQKDDATEKKRKNQKKLPPWMSQENLVIENRTADYRKANSGRQSDDVVISQSDNLFQLKNQQVDVQITPHTGIAKNESQISMFHKLDDDSQVWRCSDYKQQKVGVIEDIGTLKKKCEADIYCMKLEESD